LEAMEAVEPQAAATIARRSGATTLPPGSRAGGLGVIISLHFQLPVQISIYK
jgi:hypothetical protein